MGYYIGIDMGGTTIKAGVVTEQGTILLSDSIPTEAELGVENAAKRIAELADSLLQKSGIAWEEVISAGIGVPGTANKDNGIVEFANNLGFEQQPLLPVLQEYFDVPIYFDNDANAAAWGEFLFGCGKGEGSMVLVTLGTGIGGGIILNGELYEGCNYAAGELGHFVIDCHGKECNCGRRGCFEKYASATALVEMAREAMKDHRDSMLWELCGGDEEAADGKVLFEAAKAGDETACGVLDEFIYYLSVGVTDIINSFQPDLLCIGGGISKAADQFLPKLCEAVDRQVYTRGSEKKTRIEAAELRNDAGIIGAAFLKK